MTRPNTTAATQSPRLHAHRSAAKMEWPARMPRSSMWKPFTNQALDRDPDVRGVGRPVYWCVHHRLSLKRIAHTRVWSQPAGEYHCGYQHHQNQKDFRDMHPRRQQWTLPLKSHMHMHKNTFQLHNTTSPHLTSPNCGNTWGRLLTRCIINLTSKLECLLEEMSLLHFSHGRTDEPWVEEYKFGWTIIGRVCQNDPNPKKSHCIASESSYSSKREPPGL